MNDRDEEGVFTWQDGNPLVYEAWNEGEPNNFNSNEDCVEVLLSNALWNDARCRDEKSFICSFPVEE